MTQVRVAGLLAIDALRQVVLGRRGAEIDGMLQGLTDQDLARLTHYHLAVTGQEPLPGPKGVLVFAAAAPDVPEAVLLAAARDIMAGMGLADPLALYDRRGAIMVRAASRVMAAQTGPTELRRAAEPNDLLTLALRQPYARFFAVEEVDIGWRRFDGSMVPPVTRAAFVSGDAVTVLPYDPVRDRVLLIEQFRTGPHLRGDPQPWQLEAIAGRIDPGETPETAARREAAEEAGLDLGEMVFVAGYYPSPGAMTEYLHSYVALADLPDGVAGVFGLDSEHEDIRGHLISFDRLMQAVASGEVANAPLILTAYWLERERFRLGG